MSTIDSPIPLSEIESVLEWVDTFKLSRPTRKINRDFSDAVLLAEILSVHYPKLVEMHNYPPRNSHALKLNNWMTLNRKVLKKLKLNLCCNTMEQLANAAAGVVERVLIMVRDRIRRDDELNKSLKDSEQNVSSGGSYYEASGGDDNVLIVPLKTRVNGVLETVQQKVVNYDSYLNMKEELKDAKDSMELLKQKVEHLDDLLKLKEERIDELQNQLDRKQARRKEVESFQNILAVPLETVQSPVVNDISPISRQTSHKSVESYKMTKEECVSRIPVPKPEISFPKVLSKPSITEVTSSDIVKNGISVNIVNTEVKSTEKVKIDLFQDVDVSDGKSMAKKPSRGIEIVSKENDENIRNVDNISPDSLDKDEFSDSLQDVVTIEASITKELNDIVTPSRNTADLNLITS